MRGILHCVQDDHPLRHLERSERSLEYKEILHCVQDDGKEVQDDGDRGLVLPK
jgi:hypothetical protein